METMGKLFAFKMRKVEEIMYSSGGNRKKFLEALCACANKSLFT